MSEGNHLDLGVVAQLVASQPDFVRAWNEHVELCRRRLEVNGVPYVEALTREELAASELVSSDGARFVRRFLTRDVAPGLACWVGQI